jgi:hypothetical protein
MGLAPRPTKEGGVVATEAIIRFGGGVTSGVAPTEAIIRFAGGATSGRANQRPRETTRYRRRCPECDRHDRYDAARPEVPSERGPQPDAAERLRA